MIKLEDIEAIQPSTYNPRSADPKRLDLIELSLRKLGFLAPIFAAHVEDWPAHEAKIARFWRGAILFQPGYEGSPMIAHRRAQNVEAAHFPQWLAAFDEVLNETLSPQAAAGWSALAHRIGQGLRMGVEDIGRPSGIVPTLR